MILKQNMIKDKLKTTDFANGNFDAADIISSKNMILTKIGFETRPGICPTENPIAFNPLSYSEYAEFKLTDFFAVIDGRNAQLAVVNESDNDGYINYHILAIFSDGSNKDLGYIPFNKVSDGLLPSPYSYVIYTGKQTRGGGIYFLARICYDSVSEEFRIYEISENLSTWSELSASDIYIPTRLINGNGDRINMATAIGGFDISKPKMLQPSNLLTGNFHGYYTTDSYSHSFTLPEFDGEPEVIRCTLTTDIGTVVEWNMKASNYYMTDSDLCGDAVTAIYKPELNQVTFIAIDGEPFALSYYGLENNLRFTVECSKNSSVRVSSMRKACNITGSSKNSSSFVTVFSDSYYDPDEILWIDPEYPLYFPSTCYRRLTSDGNTESMFLLNDRIVCFKSSSVFSFKAVSAEPYKIENIVHGLENAESFKLPSIASEKRLSLPESINTASIKRTGDKVWFCSDSRKLFRLNSSLSLESFDAEIPFKPETAAVLDDRYIAINGQELSVFDPKLSEKFGVFSWIFPIKILATTDFSNNSVFFSKNWSDSVFAYTLGGYCDIYYKYDSSVMELCNEKIESDISLCLLNGRCKCRLYGITAETELSENALLELFDKDKKIGHHILCYEKNLLRRPAFFEELIAKFSFKDMAALFAVAVKYSELSKY